MKRIGRAVTDTRGDSEAISLDDEIAAEYLFAAAYEN